MRTPSNFFAAPSDYSLFHSAGGRDSSSTWASSSFSSSASAALPSLTGYGADMTGWSFSCCRIFFTTSSFCFSCWARVTAKPDSVKIVRWGAFFFDLWLDVQDFYCLKWGMSLPISISSEMCSDTRTAIVVVLPSTSRVTLAAGK